MVFGCSRPSSIISPGELQSSDFFKGRERTYQDYVQARTYDDNKFELILKPKAYLTKKQASDKQLLA